MRKLILLASTVAMLAAGCMQSPRNGASLADIDNVDFFGYTKNPGFASPSPENVQFYAAPTKGGPETLIASTRSNTAAIFLIGQTWYQFSLQNQSVPEASINCTDPNDPFVWLKAHEVNGLIGYDDLYTFDKGVNIIECTGAYPNLSAFRDNCTSADSPWAKVYLTGYVCPCLMDCDDGNECTTDSCNPASGDCTHNPVATSESCGAPGSDFFCGGFGTCVPPACSAPPPVEPTCHANSCPSGQNCCVIDRVGTIGCKTGSCAGCAYYPCNYGPNLLQSQFDEESCVGDKVWVGTNPPRLCGAGGIWCGPLP